MRPAPKIVLPAIAYYIIVALIAVCVEIFLGRIWFILFSFFLAAFPLVYLYARRAVAQTWQLLAILLAGLALISAFSILWAHVIIRVFFDL